MNQRNSECKHCMFRACPEGDRKIHPELRSRGLLTVGEWVCLHNTLHRSESDVLLSSPSSRPPSTSSSLSYFICKMEIQNTHSVFKPTELELRMCWPLLRLSLWELHTPPAPQQGSVCWEEGVSSRGGLHPCHVGHHSSPGLPHNRLLGGKGKQAFILGAGGVLCLCSVSLRL